MTDAAGSMDLHLAAMLSIAAVSCALFLFLQLSISRGHDGVKAPYVGSSFEPAFVSRRRFRKHAWSILTEGYNKVRSRFIHRVEQSRSSLRAVAYWVKLERILTLGESLSTPPSKFGVAAMTFSFSRIIMLKSFEI